MWWDRVQDPTLPPVTGSVPPNPPETFWAGVLLIPMSTMKGPNSQPGKERLTIVAANDLRRALSPADGSAARKVPHTPSHTKPDLSGGSLTNLSAQLSYRSCVHRRVPLRSSSSVMFLNKSLSISLAELQGEGAAPPASCTSTLSIRLRPSADSKLAKTNGVHRSPRAPASMSCDKHNGPETSPGHSSGPAWNRRGGKAKQTVRINGNHNKAEVSETLHHTSTLGLLSCRGPGPASTEAGGRKGNADEAALPSQSNFRDREPTFNIGPVDSWSKQTVTDITEEDGCKTNAQKASSLKKTCYYHSRPKPNSAESVSPRTLSLKEALELFRPDFISRSQGRVRRLEQRSRRRRALQDSNLDLVEQGLGEDGGRQRRRCTTPDPLSDNLFRPRERSISGREMQLRSRRIYNKLPEVTKRKEEENRRAVSQTNRLRAEVFKKRLLEQVLQR